MLSPEELERYARHIVLQEIGGPGQAALKAARVLVVGAGGLGAPALLYLAAAGVGAVGIVDDDAVALSNLQRQVIHATAEIGEAKVESAAGAIRGDLDPLAIGRGAPPALRGWLGPRRHSFANRGGRFSMNAVTPSLRSLVANRAWNTRRSKRTPSAREVSKLRLTASFAAISDG